jgi:hypothetical protein
MVLCRSVLLFFSHTKTPLVLKAEHKGKMLAAWGRGHLYILTSKDPKQCESWAMSLIWPLCLGRAAAASSTPWGRKATVAI